MSLLGSNKRSEETLRDDVTRLRGLLQSSVNKCGSDRPLTGQWPRLLLLPSRLSAGELNTSEPETSVTVTLLSVERWWSVTEVCPVQRTGPEWRATDWREEETDWSTTSLSPSHSSCHQAFLSLGIFPSRPWLLNWLIQINESNLLRWLLGCRS